MKIVILGLSLSSSWGNGHATTYRALLRGLKEHGHDVLFLERDVPWYADNRDLPQPAFCQLRLYGSLEELTDLYTGEVRQAEAVIVGSYVPQGVAVGNWALENATSAVAFYDIDTPVTLAKLERRDFEYIHPSQISRYHLYLSFTGGHILNRLRDRYASPLALPLYCSADPQDYQPGDQPKQWRMGYLGTYSPDRQAALDKLLLAPARGLGGQAFVVAGPQYPSDIDWPDNVRRIDHLPPARHAEFYNSQHLTLNITRQEMIRFGYCPSVRLFEAAACATPVLSDYWTGLDSFFKPDQEILVARTTEEATAIIRDTPDERLHGIGQAAYQRFLSEHTSLHRAAYLEGALRRASADAARRKHYRPWMGVSGRQGAWR